MALLTHGCELRDPLEHLAPLDRAVIADLVGGQLCQDAAPLNVRFGPVKLVGLVAPRNESLRVGQSATFIACYRVAAPLSPRFRLRTRLYEDTAPGAPAVEVENLDHAGPLRRLVKKGASPLPPYLWPMGTTIADPITFTLPSTVGPYKLAFGFQDRTHRAARLLKGHGEGVDSRFGGFVTTVAVRPPKLTVPPEAWFFHAKESETLVVDGLFDEPAWRRAAPFSIARNLDGSDAPQSGLRATVRGVYTDSSLYLALEVVDRNLTGALERLEDPAVWTTDSVAIILKRAGDDARHLDLRVNVQNLLFDAHATLSSPNDAPSLDIASHDVTTRVAHAIAPLGTLNKPGAADTGYRLELRIPWHALAIAATPKWIGMNLGVHSPDSAETRVWTNWLTPEQTPRFGQIRLLETASQ